MSEKFHKNVNEDFAEYFIIDAHRNYEQLVELARQYAKENREEVRKDIVEAIEVIFEVLEEETDMLREFIEFRVPTKAEFVILKELGELAKSKELEYISETILG